MATTYNRVSEVFVLIILLALLVPTINADTAPQNCVETNSCPQENKEFENAFIQDPITTARNDPVAYLKYIIDHPESIAQHPEAYEAVIEQDVKYINADKNAFRSYVETKGAHFNEINGDISSFDKTTGLIRTASSSFTLDSIKTIEQNGGSAITILKEGGLFYFISKTSESAWITGSVIMDNSNFVVEKGSIHYTMNSQSTNAVLTGGNRVVLFNNVCAFTPCSGIRFIQQGEQPIELYNLGNDQGRNKDTESEISLPEVLTLRRGVFSIDRFSNMVLEGNSLLENDRDVRFSVSQPTSYCIYENCLKSGNWIEDSTDSLKIIVKEGNKIDVEVKDGIYKRIIIPEVRSIGRDSNQEIKGTLEDYKPFFLGPHILVADQKLVQQHAKEFQQGRKYVEVKQKNGDSIFIDRNGQIFQKDKERKYYTDSNGDLFVSDVAEDSGGDYRILDDSPLFDEIKNRESYRLALQAAKEKESRITLNIVKDDNEPIQLTFQSAQGPLLAGNPTGLHTNIGHIFRNQDVNGDWDEKLTPWILKTGEPKTTINGKIVDFANAIQEYEQMGQTEEVDLLIESKIGEDYLTNEQYKLLLDKAQTIERKKAILDHQPNLELKITLAKDSPDLMAAIIDSEKEILPRQIERLILEIDSSYASQEQKQKLVKEVFAKQGELEKGQEWRRRSPLDYINQVHDPEVQKIMLQNLKLNEYNPSGLVKYLENIKRGGEQTIRLFIENVNYNDPIFRATMSQDGPPNGANGAAFRSILTLVENDPQLLQKTLQRMPIREDLGFNPDEFGIVYFDPQFQAQTQGHDFATKYSIALTTIRRINQQGDTTGEVTDRIARVTSEIINERETFSNREIIGEHTYYIPITHEEEMFSNSEMVILARDSGTAQVADQSLKGDQDLDKTREIKRRFLDLVRESGDKSPITTIHFNNHGGPDHQWLSSGQAGVQNSDDLHRPEAISYVELGDTLMQRGELERVNIIIDSCYSYDFKERLYGYLQQQGATNLPTIITETNRGQLGWGSVFNEAIKEVAQPRKPITGKEILAIEAKTFTTQDLSVSQPKAGTVRDFGSPNDDGSALPPQRPPQNNLPPSKPVFIEISKNEPDWEKALGTG
ncbi:hypothetical protein HYV86_02870 [Candidatus Woesearchaeota archaeon]|nr:hypothetical protein [Candidatus Woesearchaeota archaeon]